MMEKVMDISAVKEMIEKSKPILGYDILEICLNGPEDKLEETRYCQPAMFLGGLAGLEKLKQDKPEATPREAKRSIAAASVHHARHTLGSFLRLLAAGSVTSIGYGRPLARPGREERERSSELVQRSQRLLAVPPSPSLLSSSLLRSPLVISLAIGVFSFFRSSSFFEVSTRLSVPRG